MKTGHVPHLQNDDKVVLFDGVCKLCNAWSNFLIEYDNSKIFKLASMQSSQGQDILKWFGLPTQNCNTMLYIENGKAYTKSEAFLRIVGKLPCPWSCLRYGKIVPRFLRDWLYDRIALNRYRLFGKYEHCVLPTPDCQDRFIDKN